MADSHKLPKGWDAPRREFFVTDIGGAKVAFAFDAVANGSIDGATFLSAKCSKCDAIVPTKYAHMREHAILHLAVDRKS